MKNPLSRNIDSDKEARPIDFVVIFVVGGITIAPLVAFAYLATFNDEPPIDLVKDFGILAPITITNMLTYIGGKAKGRAEAMREQDASKTK